MKKSFFDHESNRLSYIEALKPDYSADKEDEKYMLDFAVCMTYSLDFDALIGGLIAFDDLDDLDSAIVKDELYLLDCIRRNAKNVVVFCNAGSIKVEKKQTKLYHTLLEGSIFQVALGEKKYFHPKIWVIRYRNSKGVFQYNIVVLSRNLTFDRSLDVAVRFTGEGMSKRINTGTKPLGDMLDFVAKYAGQTKKQQIKKLANEIRHLRNLTSDSVYDEISFMPFGFGAYKAKARDELRGAEEILIVSPFLTTKTVEEITSDAEKAALITRDYYVDQGVFDCFVTRANKSEVWVVKDELLDNSILEEWDTPDTPKRDIHAKIIFEKKSDNRSYLYIGSLNVTENAFDKNIEMMVCLRFAGRRKRYDYFYNEMLPEKDNPFMRLRVVPEKPELLEKEDEDELDDIIYSNPKCTVIPQGSQYTVRIFFDAQSVRKKAKIAMYGRPDEKKDIGKSVTFHRVSLHELSAFFIISRSKTQKVIIIPTTGIPEDDRDTAVMKTIVTADKLMSFISIMMMDNYSAEYREMLESEKDVGANNKKHNGHFTGLYEKLLRLSAKEPDRISNIKESLERLDVPKDKQDEMQSLNRLIDTCESAISRGGRFYGS